MNQELSAFVAYWRSSLADADLGRGGLRKDDAKSLFEVPLQTLSAGRLDEGLVNKLFADVADDINVIDAVMRPFVYLLELEHGKDRRGGLPAVVTPVVSIVKLDRNGKLHPAGHAIVPRDILEPLGRGAFSIGSIDLQDSFLTTNSAPAVESQNFNNEVETETWRAHIAFCERLFSEVAKDWKPEEDRYLPAEHWYISGSASIGGTKHVLALYDHILQSQTSGALLEQFAGRQRPAPRSCLPSNSKFVERLAHCNDEFPMAPAQRDSLAHLLAAENGELLCVNGPPGTGKTTLLLSVVATLWAKAAIEGGDPPVIVAASTNNQAVTNIIDAFGKDFAEGDGPLAGRWLPDIKSFGAFNPSATKEKELAGKYQTKAFYERVETADYVQRAERIYLTKAKDAFPTLDRVGLDSIVDHVHSVLKAASQRLKNILQHWNHLAELRKAIQTELGNDPQTELEALKLRGEQLETERKTFEMIRNRWEEFLAHESIWLALFAWLTPVATKRLRRAKLFLISVWPTSRGQDRWNDLDEIESTIAANLSRCASAAAAHRAKVIRAEKLLDQERTQLRRWHAEFEPFLTGKAASPIDLEQAERVLDNSLRFDIFRLTTHYWEGRWLQAMRVEMPNFEKNRKKTGRATVMPRLYRRMMLTPCTVSTFHMLPSLMEVQRHDGRDFVSDYLYDFVDLLIVDEAGQVSPEVAAPSFALAKKALVIGDTMQIEPIWSVTKRIDIGNMLNHGVLKPIGIDAEYERVEDSGKSAASGSVMRMAQFSSPYQYDPDLEPGLYLYEHRRCYDEIVDYCNRLCYKGKLIPCRGLIGDKAGLPAIGYLHIDGLCQLANGGSQHNLLEAKTIAAWLRQHQENLEQRYGKPLSEIVGVVTPFAAQVRAIVKECGDVGIPAGREEGSLTVGTVHALQGAERPVVLFSPVYSKHADGGFIDRRLSMLNVAVSRAKDSFLVFGDMDVFETSAPGLPRAVLSEYLFKDSANRLEFDISERSDLVTIKHGVSQLRDAPPHDAFLMHVLATAKQEVHIVTPWMLRERIDEIGALEAMKAAVERGVSVQVYTDAELNTGEGNAATKVAKAQNLRALRDHLNSAGIQTKYVTRVHSKIVIMDKSVYCVGSFNWFSARRDIKFARHETSLVYKGAAVEPEVRTVKESLQRRIAG